MNILVVGSGHLGRLVAEDLDRNGHEVAVIEEHEEKLALLDPKFRGATFIQFPMDINNLRDAGIENCDAVIVTTSDDNLNITVGQIAKRVFNIETVLSRITDPYREHIFESFGLQTICPTNITCQNIISAVTSPYKNKNVSFGSNFINFNIISCEKRYVGKRLNDVLGDENEAVFGLIRENGSFELNFPFQSPRIEANDKLVFAKKID